MMASSHKNPFATRLKSSLAAAVALSALLAGCSLGPNYTEPKPWTPQSWRKGQPATPSQPVPEPVRADWWAVFSDPELTSLEERVANANLDVRVATIRLAESRQQRRITSAQEFPQVQGTGSYTRTRLSPRGQFGLISGGSTGSTGSTGTGDSGTGGSATNMGASAGLPVGGLSSISDAIRQPFNLYQYGLDASWELDLWGRVRRSIEASDAQVDASSEDRRNTLISILAEVARDYMQLRNAQTQLAIAEENRRIAQESLTLAQQRYAGGLATQLDVNNAAAQLASVVAQVPPLQQQESVQINRLSFLLGENPGALGGELRRPNPVPPVPPRVPVGLPSELARRRPDIRAAEAQLHAATAQIGVAQANFYPSVTLSGSLSIQAIRFANLGNWDSRTYQFGPNVTIPIFEGGKLKAQLELTKTQQLEAATSFQRTVLNAFHEVDNALTAYTADQQREDQLRVVVDQNRRALVLARAQYRSGLTTFLQVLDVQRQLLSAEQQSADAKASTASDLVTLYLALGGGWEQSFPPPEPSKS